MTLAIIAFLLSALWLAISFVAALHATDDLAYRKGRQAGYKAGLAAALGQGGVGNQQAPERNQQAQD